MKPSAAVVILAASRTRFRAAHRAWASSHAALALRYASFRSATIASMLRILLQQRPRQQRPPQYYAPRGVQPALRRTREGHGNWTSAAYPWTRHGLQPPSPQQTRRGTGQWPRQTLAPVSTIVVFSRPLIPPGKRPPEPGRTRLREPPLIDPNRLQEPSSC